jgi:hypothetical protein
MGEIAVVGDLEADGRAHFHAQLTAMGYDVDAELAAAKVEAGERAQKESTAEMQAAIAEVDDLHWLCMYYLNAVKRRIVPKPRTVVRAPGLATNSHAVQHHAAIDAIQREFERGEDMWPRLSRNLDDLRHDDAMLNDWGIHHLHLGAVGGETDGRAKRSGPILMAFVQGEHAYFVDVLVHGRGHNPWINRDLVEIIHANWPETIRQYRLNAISVTKLSDEQVNILRRKNATMAVEVKDSTVYAPLGGGYMSSGISMQVLMRADRFCATVRSFETWARANADAIREDIRQQRKVELDELRIELRFTDTTIELIETQSSSRLQTDP